ncbi:MAG: B12-binding domain-containing radical SAM protein, partial [Candidatus Omnitrophica bacterium]|nr:B12-binding domain-containing radical SAM protein [Candidatus Omnitrophota bacterium]
PIDLSRYKVSADRVYGCNYGFDYKTPIHLLQLATLAMNVGWKVKLLDCPAQGYTTKRLKKYLIKNNSINLVIFFTTWLTLDEDILAANLVTQKLNGVRVLFTGPYPTWKPESFLRQDNYCVIRGEPEATLLEVLKMGKTYDKIVNTQGLSFLINGCIQHNSPRALIDINDIPLPDRRLLHGQYFFNRITDYPATIACFSRGCSYRCTYCAPHALDQAIEIEQSKSDQQKPNLRIRKIDDVVSDFEDIYNLGYRSVEICDNQFIWGKERTIEICERITNFRLQWVCYARADSLLDKDMLQVMSKAGCRLVYIGTESFDQRILDDVKKDIYLQDIYTAVRLVRECGIEPEVSVLLGSSYLETEDSIRHSINEARKLNTKFVHFSIASPLPNTSLYRLSKKNGWIRGGDFIPADNIREGLLDLPKVSSKRMKAIVRSCYFRQYLTPHFVLQQIFAPSFVRNIKYKIRALLMLIKYFYCMYFL